MCTLSSAERAVPAEVQALQVQNRGVSDGVLSGRSTQASSELAGIRISARRSAGCAAVCRVYESVHATAIRSA